MVLLVFGVDLRRNRGIISVNSAFLRSFQRLFCFIRVALSHAYSRDLTPVGYGGARREIRNRITRIPLFGAPTLKDRCAVRGGEITCFSE